MEAQPIYEGESSQPIPVIDESHQADSFETDSWESEVDSGNSPQEQASHETPTQVQGLDFHSYLQEFLANKTIQNTPGLLNLPFTYLPSGSPPVGTTENSFDPIFDHTYYITSVRGFPTHRRLVTPFLAKEAYNEGQEESLWFAGFDNATFAKSVRENPKAPVIRRYLFSGSRATRERFFLGGRQQGILMANEDLQNELLERPEALEPFDPADVANKNTGIVTYQKLNESAQEVFGKDKYEIKRTMGKALLRHVIHQDTGEFLTASILNNKFAESVSQQVLPDPLAMVTTDRRLDLHKKGASHEHDFIITLMPDVGNSSTDKDLLERYASSEQDKAALVALLARPDDIIDLDEAHISATEEDFYEPQPEASQTKKKRNKKRSAKKQKAVENAQGLTTEGLVGESKIENALAITEGLVSTDQRGEIKHIRSQSSKFADSHLLDFTTLPRSKSLDIMEHAGNVSLQDITPSSPSTVLQESQACRDSIKNDRRESISLIRTRTASRASALGRVQIDDNLNIVLAETGESSRPGADKAINEREGDAADVLSVTEPELEDKASEDPFKTLSVADPKPQSKITEESHSAESVRKGKKTAPLPGEQNWKEVGAMVSTDAAAATATKKKRRNRAKPRGETSTGARHDSLLSSEIAGPSHIQAQEAFPAAKTSRSDAVVLSASTITSGHQQTTIKPAVNSCGVTAPAVIAPAFTASTVTAPVVTAPVVIAPTVTAPEIITSVTVTATAADNPNVSVTVPVSNNTTTGATAPVVTNLGPPAIETPLDPEVATYMAMASALRILADQCEAINPRDEVSHANGMALLHGIQDMVAETIAASGPTPDEEFETRRYSEASDTRSRRRRRGNSEPETRYETAPVATNSPSTHVSAPASSQDNSNKLAAEAGSPLTANTASFAGQLPQPTSTRPDPVTTTTQPPQSAGYMPGIQTHGAGYDNKKPVYLATIPTILTSDGRNAFDLLGSATPPRLDVTALVHLTNKCLKDNYTFRCTNCRAITSDLWSPRYASVCRTCGPCSMVRYCCLECVLADAADHSSSCGKTIGAWPWNFDFLPDRWASLAPAIEPLNGKMSAALYKQMAYSYESVCGDFPNPFSSEYNSLPELQRLQALSDGRFEPEWLQRANYYIFGTRPRGGLDIDTLRINHMVIFSTGAAPYGASDAEKFNRTMNAACLTHDNELIDFAYVMLFDHIKADITISDREGVMTACQAQFALEYPAYSLPTTEQVAARPRFDPDSEWLLVEIKLYALELQHPILRLWCQYAGTDVPQDQWKRFRGQGWRSRDGVQLVVRSQWQMFNRGWTGMPEAEWTRWIDKMYERQVRLALVRHLAQHEPGVKLQEPVTASGVSFSVGDVHIQR